MATNVETPLLTPARDVGGCPVMHHDFSQPRPYGEHWDLAKQLREACPHFYNKYEGADGGTNGYWVFTQSRRRARHLQAGRHLLERVDHALGARTRSTGSCRRMVDAPGPHQYRRILNPWFSPQERWTSAEARIRIVCREVRRADRRKRAAATSSKEFALHFPTAAFLNAIGVPVSRDADRFVKWVDDFFAGFSGDPAGLEPMAKALQEIREYWVAALDERRASPRSAGDLASHLLHVEYDDERPLTDEECSTC